PPFDLKDISQPPPEPAEPGSREQPDAATPPEPAIGAPSSAPYSGPGNVFELVVMDEFRSNRDTLGSGETPEFAQVLASYGGARVTSVMRLRAGDDGEK